VNKAISEKIDFIGFDYERGKTGVESRSHLTPEARDSLKEWFAYIDKKRESEGKGKSKYVFPNGNAEHLSDQAINDIIKDLITKANITTTGKVRFHLIRKFLMNALHDSGFSDWEVKRILGKEVPVSDSTYLHGLSRTVTEKFSKAYEHIKLIGYSNKNGLRIEDLEETVKQQGKMIQYLMAENVLLKQSIPSESMVETIRRLRKEGKLTVEQIESMKERGTPEEKTTLEELEPFK
jgi:hypothetical protein